MTSCENYFMNNIVVMVVLAVRHGQGRTARDRHIRDFGTMVIRSRLAQACLHVLLDVNRIICEEHVIFVPNRIERRDVTKDPPTDMWGLPLLVYEHVTSCSSCSGWTTSRTGTSC